MNVGTYLQLACACTNEYENQTKASSEHGNAVYMYLLDFLQATVCR